MTGESFKGNFRENTNFSIESVGGNSRRTFVESSSLFSSVKRRQAEKTKYPRQRTSKDLQKIFERTRRRELSAKSSLTLEANSNCEIIPFFQERGCNLRRGYLGRYSLRRCKGVAI